MDPDYEPSEMELRTLYGLKMEQKRNTGTIDAKLFENITSKNKNVNTFVLYYSSFQHIFYHGQIDII